METIKLNIGCGKDIKEGYVNIDSYPNNGVDVICDGRSLLYDDYTIDEIYAAHIIEHFPPQEIGNIINEWKRVLKPGGKLILIYPDIEKTCRVWLEHPHRRQRLMHNFVGTPWWPGHTHYWGWYQEAVEGLVSKLGMVNIESFPSDTMPDITDTCTMTIAYKDKYSMPEYSIIIPVLNQFDNYTKNCIESIIEYTEEDYELIVIDNGSNEENRNKMQALADKNDQISVYFYDSPLGYPKAINEGLKYAKSDYIILLNNDTLILTSKWISMLREAVDVPDVGLAGPLLSPLTFLDGSFIVFFCVIIKREVFNTIGLLDESFGIGAGEDCAFCILAQDAGYKLNIAGELTDRIDETGKAIGSFPIWHAGEGTVHHEIDREKWQENFDTNTKRLIDMFPERYNKLSEEPMFKSKTLNPLHSYSVTVVIPTRDRYDSLAHTLRGLAFQTYGNFNITIVDNSDEIKDIRNIPMIQYQLDHLTNHGIEWKVLIQRDKGPHICHQTGDEDSVSDLILRIDDDEVPEPDVIESLVRHFADPDVGAVAPLVLMPDAAMAPKYMDMKPNLISHIVNNTNIQWYKHSKEDVIWDNDHLYSCYMYRRDIASNIGGYNMTLSEVGHREESDFSYRIMMAGFALGVDTSTVVWHYRLPHGGIRSSNTTKAMFESDNSKFWEIVVDSKKDMINVEFVPMFAGIGDHIAASSMLRALKEHKPDHHIIVGAAAPELIADNPYVYDVWPPSLVVKITNDNRSIYKRGFETKSRKSLKDIWCEEYNVSNHHPIEVYIPDEDYEWAKSIMPDNKEVILIAPFSTHTVNGKKSSYKDWEIDKWNKLISQLHSKGYIIWQLGTKNEIRLEADRFISEPLTRAIALVKYCYTFISVDTWIQHAGMALNKRGIVLWGETDYTLFGYPDFHVNICNASPDPDKQWLYNDNLSNDKMKMISVDDVLHEIDSI